MGVHSVPRRDFLKAGSLAFGGLALADVLAADTAKKEILCIVIFQTRILRSLPIRIMPGKRLEL